MWSIREATKTCLKQPWRNWIRDIRSTRRSVIIYMRSLLFTRRRMMRRSLRLSHLFPPPHPPEPAPGRDLALVTQFGAMEQEQGQCLPLHHREVAETAKVPLDEISHWMTRSPQHHLHGADLSPGVLAEVQVKVQITLTSDWVIFWILLLRWWPRSQPYQCRGERTQYQLWEEETSPASSQESLHQREEDQEEDQRRWYQGNHWFSHRRCF